jgi:energy-converting hydrogenase Eha subunit B
VDAETFGYLRHVADVVRRAKRVFFIALVLSVLLAVNVVFLGNRKAAPMTGVCGALGPLLLWSLVAAAYAFQTVAQASTGMTAKVSAIILADRERAMRIISAIKARLGPRAAVEAE